jgi:hypothetical protein
VAQGSGLRSGVRCPNEHGSRAAGFRHPPYALFNSRSKQAVRPPSVVAEDAVQRPKITFSFRNNRVVR